MKSSNSRFSLAGSVALGCCIAGSAMADQSVYACTNSDGAVELTSQPTSNQCEQLATTPENIAAVNTPAAVAGTVTGADGNQIDVRAQYRELMIQSAQRTDGGPAMPANPATSRRYLMMNRATYEQTINNSVK